MREKVDFKITKPHGPECRGIGWYFPNGHRGINAIEQRDRGGKRRGLRDGYLPDWFVLACNDPTCPAEQVAVERRQAGRRRLG